MTAPPLVNAHGETIIPLRWFSPMGVCIGIVAVIGEIPEPWYKLYIGVGDGVSADADARNIAAYGSPIHDEQLSEVLFPTPGNRVHHH